MKRTITSFFVLTLLVILLGPALLLAQGNVLFLVGDANNLNASDGYIKFILEQKGYTVTLVSDELSDPAVDVVGQDIILVSSTVASGDVADFGTVTLPLAVWEQADLDDYYMTSSQGNQNPEENIITIVDDTHPLATGLSGNILLSEAGGICAGVPYQSAEIIGVVTDDNTQAAWFVYEQGDSLDPSRSTVAGFPADGLAPAMRIGLPFNDPTFTTHTPEATTVLMNSVDYMLDGAIDANLLVLDLITYDTLDMQPGQKVDLDVQVHPSNATDGTVSYVSSDPSVVVVDDDGLVIAIAAGSAEITVSSNDGSVAKVVDVDVIDLDNASVLFLVGNANMNKSDAYVARILEITGYIVNVVDDDDCVVGDTLAQDMLIVSSTVNSGSVFKYGFVDKPIAVWEAGDYDDWAMTSSDGSSNPDEKLVNLINTAHPIATGLPAGEWPTAYTDNMSRGVPYHTASIIATMVDNPANAAWFLYEQGDSLNPARSGSAWYPADGLAPGMRIGVPFGNNTFEAPAPGGVALLLNTADYMADGAINSIRPGVDVRFLEDEVDEQLHPATVQLTPMAYPYNTTDMMTLESLDESIATVTQEGLVTSVDKGNVGIVAHLAGFTDTIYISIRNPVFVDGVTLDVTSATLEVWDQLQLTPTITPANADSMGVSWESSDPGVASVTEDGLVQAESVGTATITLTTDDGGYTATAEITVILQDASLSGLVANKGTMDPAFDPEVTGYTLTLPEGTMSVFLTAAPSRDDAMVTGAGAYNVASGSATATIVVTAPAGNSITYTVDIVVEGVGVNTLFDAGIRMYPNPASTSVKLEGIPANASVKMISSVGQVVLDAVTSDRDAAFDLSGLGQGMYLIQVEIDGVKYHSRLIIN